MYAPVMSAFQLLIIGTLSLFYGAIVLMFCRSFTKDLKLPLVLFVPIVNFSFGFMMRLSENKQIVDLGFFFTESSTIFIYILFTLALILGQLKYWKKGGE